MSDGKLVYDICATPEGWNLDKIVQIWKEHNIVLYDSHNGDKPFIYDSKDIEGVLVDVSNTTPEILSKISNLIKE